jgi:hypothetical protein
MKTSGQPHKGSAIRNKFSIKDFVSDDSAERCEQVRQILAEATERRRKILCAYNNGDEQILSTRASEVLVLWDTMKICEKLLNHPQLH